MNPVQPVPSLTEPTNLFGCYTTPHHVYDEMLSEPGMLRPHWNEVIDCFNSIGAAEVARRSRQAQLRVNENGVTYNVYGAPGDKLRPWEIDLVPLVIAASEWTRLSEALTQRARLLNLILGDLYGSQSLLQRGLLPPELIFAHPGFRRPFHGLPISESGHLSLYGVELARSVDGDWWVMADRTSAVLGSGYTLENRLVVSRMLPDLIHRCQIQRLAPFFITLQETLTSLACRNRTNPRIVILSQGPSNPYYFEDVYLARYLGYTLVEGGDLAVRNNTVSLKTLGGLLPVDVILRRCSEAECDPLELGGDSRFGVPGLIQAVRSNNVAVANSLGCGLIESPVFMAFLPGLCRELLGEELKLPSIATWWCGDAQPRKYVLDHLSDLVIKPAFQHSGQNEIIVDQLSSAQTDELARQIESAPHDFVAQETIARSAAPVWNDGVVDAGHVALRTFLVANGDSFSAMPGALVRVAASPDPLELSISAGECSKDAWVLSDGPIENVSLLRPTSQSITLRRGGAELPSRVADELFWLGRHTERADAKARLLRSLINRLTSETATENLPEVPLLLRVLSEQGQIQPGFAIENVDALLPSIERSLPVVIYNAQEPMSLRSTVVEMHRLGSIVRDHISTDNWYVISRIEQDFLPPHPDHPATLTETLESLDKLIIDLIACTGLTSEGMTRSSAWRFLDLGRRVESTLQTSRLVRSTLGRFAENEISILQAILDVRDSKMTYRSRYLASINVTAVIDLILTDETNPRSLAWQLAAIAKHVEELPDNANEAVISPVRRIATSALHRIRMADPEQLARWSGTGHRENLDSLLDARAQEIKQFADELSRKYLIHSGTLRQFTESRSREPNETGRT